MKERIRIKNGVPITKASSPPTNTTEQRQSKKELSTTAIEFVRRQIDILKPYELSRSQRLRTYQIMLQDDAVATCFGARTMAVAKAQAKGKVLANMNSEESLEAKRFVDYCLHELDNQSPLTIGYMASHMIRDGWSPFEMVFDSGEGEWSDKWRLKKLAYIHPMSLDSFEPWRVLPDGKTISMLRQKPDAFMGSNGYSTGNFAAHGGVKEIPFNRVCYSSYSGTDSQPSGNSLFDAAYIPWKEKQMLQDLTLIGVQKDLAGMPILGAPSSLLAAAAENPSGAEAQMVEQLKANLANLHAGDQAYSIIPTDTHSENGSGQRQFELKFQGVDGSGKAFDVVELVEQRRKAIFNCFFCQNMISGENGGGSYNLLEGQSSLQAHAVELDNMVVDHMMNKQIIPKLLRLNGYKLAPEDVPVWKSGNVQELSQDEKSKTAQRVGAVGLLPKANAKFLNELYEDLGYRFRFDEELTEEEVMAQLGADTSRSGDGMASGLPNSTSDFTGSDTSVGNNENS